MHIKQCGLKGVVMNFIQIYFALGSAMLLVVLWDYQSLPKTAKRLTKQAGENAKGFALITNAIRNLTLMALMGFFLWPIVVWLEMFTEGDK